MSRSSNASRPAQKNVASMPESGSTKSSASRQRATRIRQVGNPADDLCKSTPSGDDAGARAFQTRDTDEIVRSIDVAVEMLRDTPADEQSESLPDAESHSEVSPEGDLTGPRSGSSAKPVSTMAPLSSARDELAQLGESLRQEFRNSVAELQAAQAAAATAQSEVLKTLTEVVFQSAASRDISPESLERAFAGVEDRLIARLQAATAPLASAAPTCSEPRTSSTVSPATNPVKLKNAADSVSRSWEQIRSELIENGEISESPTPSRSSSSETLHEVTQLSSDRHFRLPEQDPALEVPRAEDPALLSESELRDALRERDIFISTLIARIRRQQETATGQLSSEQLRTLVTELPEELAVQVRHTLKQMDDLARLGELELSLERARIARQVNELEHSRQLLLRNARQLGWDLNPDGTVSPPARQSGRTGSSSRRWLGKLGFGQ